MEIERNGKIDRVLELYTKLISGNIINKANEAQNYGVNERSIQRDIEDIRNFLEVRSIEDGYVDTVKYDREKKGYCLEQSRVMKLTNSEILAICKILLDSRAFTKKEMESMLGRLIDCCIPKENAKMVDDLIKNEEFHYIEPRHKTVFIEQMWEIGQAIRNFNYIEIKYLRNKDKSIVSRKVKPVAIMFSEFYFYLTAFIDDKDESREHFDVLNDAFPTIYRIDRIKELKVLDEKFHIPYSSRFEEGEFRKRIQFMYGGKLQKIKFIYSGPNVEAVLDRLPTAEILEEKDGTYTIKAETFGTGIDMWLRSQGEYVRVI
ncbi:WYL domain-containing transcriptional regulator [Clostridiales bacterium COT073_COT-073]|nr:WYL domain-containing transcriptional regulator [Clostridiales bacterium COT073_COT-073]